MTKYFVLTGSPMTTPWWVWSLIALTAVIVVSLAMLSRRGVITTGLAGWTILGSFMTLIMIGIPVIGIISENHGPPRGGSEVVDQAASIGYSVNTDDVREMWNLMKYRESISGNTFTIDARTEDIPSVCTVIGLGDKIHENMDKVVVQMSCARK